MRGASVTGWTRESSGARYRAKPVVIHRASREPPCLPLDRQNGGPHKKESTLICAPILFDRKPVCALAVVLPLRSDRDYSRSVKFLRMMAFMIAQAMKVHRLIASERQHLVEENIHLREELCERYDFS